MAESKLYRNRTCSLRDLEPYYHWHVSAMTEEALHSKSDIAVELAIRDKRIAALESDALLGGSVRLLLEWASRAQHGEHRDVILKAGGACVLSKETEQPRVERNSRYPSVQEAVRAVMNGWF